MSFLLKDIPRKPAGAFRILHCSDIHAGILDWQWRYLLDKRLFGRLNQAIMRQKRLSLENLECAAALCREGNADAVVCTGDLTSLGSQEEFHHAEELLEPLRKAAGRNFLYVPGNHDAYVKANRPFLEEAFRKLNGDRVSLEELPCSITIGPVEFILLNPARPCAVWLSSGSLSSSAWSKLDYILSRPIHARVRALVTHFPVYGFHGGSIFWRTRMECAERLVQWGREGRFQLLLAGHIHTPFCISPDAGGFWQLCAGSLTIRNSLAILDIDRESGSLTPHILHC